MLLWIILGVALYLLAAFPAFLVWQRLLIDAYRRVAEFDLDVIDPPKLVPLGDGPEAGVMLDLSAQKYSELARADIEEARDEVLDSIYPLLEFEALYGWSSVKALYAAGHLENTESFDVPKERRDLLKRLALRAPVWPVTLITVSVMHFFTRAFVRQVRNGDY